MISLTAIRQKIALLLSYLMDLLQIFLQLFFMKKLGLLLITALLSTALLAQQPTKDAYRYKVNLNQVEDDKIEVELEVPESIRDNKVAKFHLPKIIPGTYAIYNFGRFATDVKAYGKNGKELKATKFLSHPDDNTWVITKAKKLYKLTYTIEDTWDTDKDKPFSPEYIFEPAGTNIEEGKNFVFNNNGLFGYFEGLERKDYFMEFDRPANFFGATSLIRTGGDEDTDIFYAPNYMDVVDAPIMFNEPDTAIIKVGNADVLISTYSPTGKVSSKFIKGEVAPILQAQKEYLGGTLPVDRYAFIIYLSEGGNTSSGGFGALEHSYSSFYFLPETEPQNIAQTVRDVAAHEFFHIVTPLNIHSNEIHNFDFINPQMSQHLWLYEGVTEYSAGHVQVKHGLMPVEQYFNVLSGKMRNASNYKDDLSFTEMSKGCLKEYKDQYTNVYEKGALIGMCLDVQLRTLSNGKMGIQELMTELAKEYGKDKGFEDDVLFDKIVSLTYPEVGQFFEKHVIGGEPLPIKELVANAGINYYPSKKVKSLSPLGGISQRNVGFDGASFFIATTDGLDVFGTEMIGFREGDKLLEWNGQALSIQTINTVLGTYIQSVKEGDDLTIKVKRGEEEVELTTKLTKVEVEQDHVFELDPKASDKQIAIRKAWLGDYKSEAVKEEIEESDE